MRAELSAARRPRGAALGTHKPTYASWRALRGRLERRAGYQGLDMDPRWRKYEQFLSDMGERPEGHTLDRKDNTKGYWPDNCRWATPKTQARNRKGSMPPELAARAEDVGLSRSAVSKRKARGWGVEAASSSPPRAKAATTDPAVIQTRAGARTVRLVTAGGVTKSLSEWSRTTGIGVTTLQRRLDNGWAPDSAVSQKPLRGQRQLIGVRP